MVTRHTLQVVMMMLLVALEPGCNIALPTQATPREPLDALWERRMLEGRGVRMWLDDKWQPSTVEEGRSFVDLRNSHKERNDPVSYLFAFSDQYGITIMRHVEGYWRNGGWTLTGGPLGIAATTKSTIELFGKATIRTPVHIPSGIFYFDPPTETGYEFFLLQRPNSTGIAVIIRRWVVQPADVVKDQHGYPRATAVLRYDTSTHVAAVSITGLRQPVKDRLDVSAAAPAQLKESPGSHAAAEHPAGADRRSHALAAAAQRERSAAMRHEVTA